MLIKCYDTLLDWNWGDGIHGLIVTTGVYDHTKRHQFLIGFDFRST